MTSTAPEAARTAARKAILIDIDGTLLDSNDAHAHAWVEVLRRHGHDIAFDQVRPLIGKGGDKLLEELIGIDDETGEGERMSNERRDLFAERYLATLKPMNGARALLERLAADRIQLVVATSAGGDELTGLLKQAGLDDLIDEASTSSDAEDSKPDPDIVLAALKKAGVSASDAVMLGDTPYDIAAAKAAGVAAIAVRCGGWWDDAAFADAAGIYDDPADLLDGLAGSPLYAPAGSTLR